MNLAGLATRVGGRTALLAATLLVLPLLLALPAGATAKAKLRVTELTNPPASSEIVRRIKVTATFENRGDSASKRAELAFFLSKDGRLDEKDVPMGGSEAISSLGDNKERKLAAELGVPPVAPGPYRLIACIGDPASLLEQLPSVPCRRAPKKIRIKAIKLRNVGLALDGSRAQSATITAAGGGSVTATSTAGVRFTLTIPPGALLDDETITLTPITSASGLGNSFVAGVRLDPESLDLKLPALLTVEGARPVALNRQAGGSTLLGGQAFSPEPLARTQTPTFKLFEFAEYYLLDLPPPKTKKKGTGKASAELTALASAKKGVTPSPAQVRRAVKGRVQDAFRQERANQLLGKEGGDPAQLAKTINQANKDYFKGVVEPLAKRAGRSDAAARLAFQEFLGFQRGAQLLGAEGASKAELDAVQAQLDKAQDKAIQRAIARCRGQGANSAAKKKVKRTAPQNVAHLLGLMRESQLLGQDKVPENLAEIILNCKPDPDDPFPSYQLDIDAAFHIDDRYDAEQDQEVNGEFVDERLQNSIILSPPKGVTKTGRLVFEVDAPANWVLRQLVDPDCSPAFISYLNEVTRVRVRLDIAFDKPANRDEDPVPRAELAVRILTTTPGEIIGSCGDDPSFYINVAETVWKAYVPGGTLLLRLPTDQGGTQISGDGAHAHHFPAFPAYYSGGRLNASVRLTRRAPAKTAARSRATVVFPEKTIRLASPLKQR